MFSVSRIIKFFFLRTYEDFLSSHVLVPIHIFVSLRFKNLKAEVDRWWVRILQFFREFGGFVTNGDDDVEGDNILLHDVRG